MKYKEEFEATQGKKWLRSWNESLEIEYQKAYAKYLELKITDVSGNALLSKARQMRLEQQLKINSYNEHYNQYEIGTLNGIDRIVKLIERHYH